MTRWLVPALSIVLGVLIAIALLGRNATPLQVGVSVAVVLGYAAVVAVLQRRSDVAAVLSGHPADERWAAINDHALSLAAQVTACALVVAFLWTTFAGGDALPYAWVGALLAVAYVGGILWYRIRS